MARPYIERIGRTLLFFEARIVDAVKKVLEGAAHIPEVFRRAEDDTVRGHNIFRGGINR